LPFQVREIITHRSENAAYHRVGDRTENRHHFCPLSSYSQWCGS
jgi:hypothetical protein